jgi:hypothetical protein
VDALTSAHVVLWFEHDLYDQLQLLDALSLAREHDATPELIVVGAFEGRPDFRGLGELQADELQTLWPQRAPATRDLLDLAATAWKAVRAPDPRAVAALVRAEAPGLPFLAAALRRLLEELPAAGDGLSTTERFALQAVRDGAATPLAAFFAAQELEAAPFLGDSWFFRSLTELARGERRLLETSDGEPLPPPPPLGDASTFVRLPLRLTDAGERVLAGDLDRIELLGVDRWVGGTHVTLDDLWRWDAAAEALSRG